MHYYELRVEERDLKATPCEPVDIFTEDTQDAFEMEFEGGRHLFSFFKRVQEDLYEPVWGQHCYYKDRRYILPLEDDCDLESDTPVDAFSWEEDFDEYEPNHKIILEKE